MRCGPIVNLDANSEAFEAARSIEHSKFVTDEEALKSARVAYALLFNVGSGNEGIYSRRLPTETGGGLDLVVCFEDEDDALRYAEMLSADDFPSASPSQVATADLLDFCQEGGMSSASSHAGRSSCRRKRLCRSSSGLQGRARRARRR